MHKTEVRGALWGGPRLGGHNVIDSLSHTWLEFAGGPCVGPQYEVVGVDLLITAVEVGLRVCC